MSADDLLPGQIADEPRTTEEVLANITVDKLDDNVKKWLNDQNTQTLNGALAFVPFILQQAYYEGNLDEEQIVIHNGSGGVVFSDASGFTALTEKLAKQSNGAELLSQCLTAFFTPLIDLINAYRGDTIKFSGDALMITSLQLTTPSLRPLMVSCRRMDPSAWMTWVQWQQQCSGRRRAALRSTSGFICLRQGLMSG